MPPIEAVEFLPVQRAWAGDCWMSDGTHHLDAEATRHISRPSFTRVPCEKTVSVSEFSLCSSRACLGKMISLCRKWAKAPLSYLHHHLPNQRSRRGSPAAF